jgi:hypothetical protein
MMANRERRGPEDRRERRGSVASMSMRRVRRGIRRWQLGDIIPHDFAWTAQQHSLLATRFRYLTTFRIPVLF